MVLLSYVPGTLEDLVNVGRNFEYILFLIKFSLYSFIFPFLFGFDLFSNSLGSSSSHKLLTFFIVLDPEPDIHLIDSIGKCVQVVGGNV